MPAFHRAFALRGTSTLLAHIGYPTHGFRSPSIYNPWFAAQGIDAAVVPMAVTADDFAQVFPSLMRIRNVRGALITMPHKVSVVALLDAHSPAVAFAGACNAVLRRADGSLYGEQFDGEGFVRALSRHGFAFDAARCLLVGCGGVGAPIAAALASRGVAEIGLDDNRRGAAEALAERLAPHFPATVFQAAQNDPSGYDLAVNATPLGMREGDPLPLDPARLDATCLVADVVLGSTPTPLLAAAQARGCRTQDGDDMLFEQIPAYLDFFGFGSTTAESLRELAATDER